MKKSAEKEKRKPKTANPQKKKPQKTLGRIRREDEGAVKELNRWERPFF